ncbi:hypothetical protein [Thermodesulfovibrio hydrogeniphilus]
MFKKVIQVVLLVSLLHVVLVSKVLMISKSKSINSRLCKSLDFLKHLNDLPCTLRVLAMIEI